MFLMRRCQRNAQLDNSSLASTDPQAAAMLQKSFLSVYPQLKAFYDAFREHPNMQPYFDGAFAKLPINNPYVTLRSSLDRMTLSCISRENKSE